jgi:secreted Zn-dependent insulinase-like peptidase
MPSRNKTFFLAVILAIAFSFFKGTFDHQPITSANDEKQYRYLELDNQLKVLLISDKKADHGAASLDVHVGSLQDPKGREGLAHFLEHMLFLGTKTYPTAGDYQSFISQHGGSHNAFTAPEHTNYFFQIDAKELNGALDRFSRFFHEPLFTEEYVQREKNAVESEYKSKYKDDFRRIQYASKTTFNPEHPASRFATGNLDTLSDNDSSKIRDDLLTFYDRYYNANIMTLVVYGPQDIATLENWVKPLFSPIKDEKTLIDAYPDQLNTQAPLDIHIKPVKDILSVSYTFELASALKHYKEKPTQFIGHLLGHEGEGSLLAWLKDQGWAEGLSAGLRSNIRNNSTFQINISLTEQGLNHINEITTQLFAYIDLVKAQGIKPWVFEELQQLGNLHFTFQEGVRPAQLVQSLSMNMHEYSQRDILRGPYYWEKFNPERITQYLNKLTPENMIRTLVYPDAKTNKIDPWFEAPYKTENINPDVLANWKTAELADGLFIPAANPFIPEDVSILADNKQLTPKLIQSQAGFDIWHMQDVSFNGPQSNIYLNLRSNLSKQSVRNKVLIEAWVNMLNDHLNSYSYPAALAGQGYSLYTHSRGIGIRLQGYRDKQDELLNKILSEIKSYVPSQEEWRQAKEELERAYQNSLKKKPYERTIAELNQYMTSPSFSEQDALNALKSLNVEDVQAMTKNYLEKLQMVLLGHGNISKDQLLATSGVIQTKLLKDSQADSVDKKKLKQLPNGLTQKTIHVNHSDSAFTMYLQARTNDLKERATLGLVAQVLKAPYYTYMRTERKHGYIVFATAYPILEQGGMAFIVQSPVTPSKHLLSETMEFIEGYIPTLEAMSDEDFTAHQQGLVTNLLKKPLNLQEKTGRYWSEIDRDNGEFNTLETLADHIQTLNQQDIINYINDHILAKDSKAVVFTHDPS